MCVCGTVRTAGSRQQAGAGRHKQAGAQHTYSHTHTRTLTHTHTLLLITPSTGLCWVGGGVLSMHDLARAMAASVLCTARVIFV